MKNLISMTDFVLEQQETIASDEITQADWYDIEATKLEKVRNYAKFLQQTLKLEMFVPVDEDGNVLKEPTNLDRMKASWMDNPIDDNFYKVKTYNKAKEKVLFEGFEIMKKSAVSNCVWIKNTETKFHIHTKYGTTIEHLVKSKLQLTESAIKQIQ